MLYFEIKQWLKWDLKLFSEWECRQFQCGEIQFKNTLILGKKANNFWIVGCD